MSLRIALVGEDFAASRTPQRAAALAALGHRVSVIPTRPPGWSYETPPSLLDRLRHRLRLPADQAGANRRLLEAAQAGLDVAWLDNAATIRRSTLLALKGRGVRLVWYSEDDMMNPRLGSRWLDRSLDLFDLWITTKSYNARPEEMPARGVRHVLRVDNCFDPAIHHPEAATPALAAEIGFIGTYEAPRAASLVTLAEAGLRVRVWGNGWGHLVGRQANLVIEDRPIYNEDFRAAVSSTKVNLCFLRKANRDLQTCRSVEVPACGGFMLHERNAEITALFEEDRHAGYFGDDAELVTACRNWLAHDDERIRVAAAGLSRVAELKLDHGAMVARALAALDGLTVVSSRQTIGYKG